ncbi:MAG TPA: pyruvate flavodoxin/ferredoxin oxidoreductase [Candidatus Limnocylindria bacterium]|nr:pyruvate flavodoxin/ferredoxin oxidoreductase [Candidatus Limnocylindria bacterium]
MREYVDGNAAIVRGAVAAGCTFFAGYPITPASGILMAMMRELPARGGVAIQGEDEIASIGMCIGAAMAGSRAMTATSGPGMSLMGENLGLAIMGEVPLVVVDVQRLGPATGGATTVGQGDVQFARWGTPGGFPTIALAPTDAADAYRLTIRAFELADRFRCPVVLLTDKEVATTLTTVDAAAFAPVAVVERELATAGAPYRYAPAADVPALRRYGAGDAFRFTGSTHDERAMITKDRPTVDALNRHLAAKVEKHVEELTLVELDWQPGARTLVVSYGVTAGAARAAVEAARQRGRAVASLVIRSLWPVPEAAIRAALGGIERVIVPELNLGQYRREIERLTGDREVIGVNRVDGDLIGLEEILEAVG